MTYDFNAPYYKNIIVSTDVLVYITEELLFQVRMTEYNIMVRFIYANF